jgi:hypothetical protein
MNKEIDDVQSNEVKMGVTSDLEEVIQLNILCRRNSGLLCKTLLLHTQDVLLIHFHIAS